MRKTLMEYAGEHGMRGRMLLEEYSASNRRPPEKIAYASNMPALWICHRCGHRWEALVVNRTCHEGMCPNCRAAHTSGDEQIIYALLSRELTKRGCQVLNRHKVSGREVDVFVPELGFGVEFDGAFWHRSRHKQDIDREKWRFFEGAGLDIVRIVEGRDRTAEGVPCNLRVDGGDRSLLLVRRFLQWYLKDRYQIEIDCEMTEDEVFLSRMAARRPIEGAIAV